MADPMPEPQSEASERAPKSSLSAPAASTVEGPDADPDQYGWGV